MPLTEGWTSAYNKKGTDQHRLPDGSWVHYAKGIYDSRDIMNDCICPQWELSGEYMIEIMPETAHSNSDRVFTVYTDKEWGNYIAANIQTDKFQTMSELIDTLIEMGKKYGTYTETNPRSSSYVTLKHE